MAPFGVLFVGNSYPITSDYFAQVDPTHWVSVRHSSCCWVLSAAQVQLRLNSRYLRIHQLELHFLRLVLLLQICLCCSLACDLASVCIRLV